MADSLLDNYNPLYDIHLRQYFALPHMQKHLQKMGLLESTLNLHGDEVYARHHAMMDMMLKNREAQLLKMAELRKKLDAAEKVEICRRIRSGQSPESYRRGKPSRSLSRSRAAQKGGRQRRFSNSFEDRDFVQDIEVKNTDPIDYDNRDPYKRLSANAKRFNYLHKLDDPTLIAYKDNLKKQLQRLERFREISFGPHSVARQPPPPQTSWFFRRRSLPSLTASAPGNTLKDPLRSILSMRGRKTTAHVGNKSNVGGDSRTSCPPTTRKRRDSNPRLPPINVQKIKPQRQGGSQTSAFGAKLPPSGKGKSPARGRPPTKRVTTTTTTVTTTSSEAKPIDRSALSTVGGKVVVGGAAAVAAGAATVAATQLVTEKPVVQHTPTPPSSPVLEAQKTFDIETPTDETKEIEFPESPTLENRKPTPAASPVTSENQEEYGAHVNQAFDDEPYQSGDRASVESGATEPHDNVVFEQRKNDESASESEPEYAEEDEEVQRAFADDETEKPREIPELKVDYYESTEDSHIIEKRNVEEQDDVAEDLARQLVEEMKNSGDVVTVEESNSPSHEEQHIESSEYVRHASPENSEVDQLQHESTESPIQHVHFGQAEATPPNDVEKLVAESPTPSEKSVHQTQALSPAQSLHEETAIDQTPSIHEDRESPIQSVHIHQEEQRATSPVLSLHEEQISTEVEQFSSPTQSAQEHFTSVSPVQPVYSNHDEFVVETVANATHSVHEEDASEHLDHSASPVNAEVVVSPVPSVRSAHDDAVSNHIGEEAQPASPDVHEQTIIQHVSYSVHEEHSASPIQSVHNEPIESNAEGVSPVPSVKSSIHEDAPTNQDLSSHDETGISATVRSGSPAQSTQDEIPASLIQSVHISHDESPMEPAISPVSSIDRVQDDTVVQHAASPVTSMKEGSEQRPSPIPSIHDDMQRSSSKQSSHEQAVASPVPSIIYTHEDSVIEQPQHDDAPASPAVSAHQEISPAQSVHEHVAATSPVPSITSVHEETIIEQSHNEEVVSNQYETPNQNVSESHVQPIEEQEIPSSDYISHESVTELASQEEIPSIQTQSLPSSPVQSIHEQASPAHSIKSSIDGNTDELPPLEEITPSSVQSVHDSFIATSDCPVQSSHENISASPVPSIKGVHEENAQKSNQTEDEFIAKSPATSVHEESNIISTHSVQESAASPVPSVGGSQHELHTEQEEHVGSPVLSAPVDAHENVEKSISPVQPVHEYTNSFENKIDMDAANEAASLIEEALSEAPAIIEMVNKIEGHELVKDPEEYEHNYESNIDQMTQSIYQPNDEVESETREWDDGTQHIKQTHEEFTNDDGTSHISHTVTVITDQHLNNDDDNGSTDSLIIHDEPSDYQMTQSYYQPRDEKHTVETVTTTTTTTVIKSGVDDDLKNNNDDEEELANETHVENGNIPRHTVHTASGIPSSRIIFDDGDDDNVSSL